MSLPAAAGWIAVFWIVAGTVNAAHAKPDIRAVRVASGLERPVCIGVPPGDYERLFIVEQRTGRIRILRGGEVLPRPFLNIGPLINIRGEERGLLGLAFHPDFARNGVFYVNYTRSGDGATIVSRFTVSADPDSADAASEAVLLTVAQPYSNHNGGGLAFGPDGYLYIGMGDGGSANDPENRAQDEQELLGKLLRIRVNGAARYTVPEDNPLVREPARNEIWAKGLRNPWRFSFDRETGDLYIADVGQNEYEEIHVQPAGSKGGENYGWRCMEASRCTGFGGCRCNGPDLEKPVYEYSHKVGCSVTGGYVYRGCAIPELRGAYFFGDYCSGRIWSFRWRGGGITDFADRTRELAPGEGPGIRNISSFGQDNYGELYICDHLRGEIFKIVPAALDDCNRNWISDHCEITAGTAADRNRNGLPDECEETGTVVPLDAPPALFAGGRSPFRGRYDVVLDLSRDTLVEVTLFRVRDAGTLTLLHDSLRAGKHTVTFDAAREPPGVYIGQVTAGASVAREKLLHLNRP